MKKYKLKIKYIPHNDYIVFSNEHYVVKRRYLGFFWKTQAYFKWSMGEGRGTWVSGAFKLYASSLEEAKQEALTYMENYCQILQENKQAKRDLKEAYREQRKWEKNETVYKTCECKTK